MTRINHNTQHTNRERTLLRLLPAILLCTLALLAGPTATHAQERATRTTTITIQVEQSVIDQIREAAKGAATATRGGMLMIPVRILVQLGMNAVMQEISNGLQCHRICELFDLWAADQPVGATGTLTITFNLVPPGGSPGPGTPQITVNLFAKKTGQGTPTAGKSGSTGYTAPVGPGGGPTMRLAVGPIVLERLECPCQR